MFASSRLGRRASTIAPRRRRSRRRNIESTCSDALNISRRQRRLGRGWSAIHNHGKGCAGSRPAPQLSEGAGGFSDMLGCNAEVPLGVDIVEQQKVICGMEGLNGRDAEALDDEFAPLVPLAREWGFFYFR